MVLDRAPCCFESFPSVVAPNIQSFSKRMLSNQASSVRAFWHQASHNGSLARGDEKSLQLPKYFCLATCNNPAKFRKLVFFARGGRLYSSIIGTVWATRPKHTWWESPLFGGSSWRRRAGMFSLPIMAGGCRYVNSYISLICLDYFGFWIHFFVDQ